MREKEERGKFLTLPRTQQNHRINSTKIQEHAEGSQTPRTHPISCRSSPIQLVSFTAPFYWQLTVSEWPVPAVCSQSTTHMTSHFGLLDFLPFF